MSKIVRLPKRAQVKLADTWDLSSLCASDEAWEKEFARLDKLIPGFEKFKGLVVVQGGTLDEGQGFEKLKVDAELYVSNRAHWLKEMEGARQVETVP